MSSIVEMQAHNFNSCQSPVSGVFSLTELLRLRQVITSLLNESSSLVT